VAVYWNRELETMPWPQVRRMQLARLSDLVESLAQRSRFYAEKLSGLPLKARHLEELPFTRKDELRRAQAEARPGEPLGSSQAVALDEIVQFVSSSGTTGRPMV